jgi:hypothetical protein
VSPIGESRPVAQVALVDLLDRLLAGGVVPGCLTRRSTSIWVFGNSVSRALNARDLGVY